MSKKDEKKVEKEEELDIEDELFDEEDESSEDIFDEDTDDEEDESEEIEDVSAFDFNATLLKNKSENLKNTNETMKNIQNEIKHSTLLFGILKDVLEKDIETEKIVRRFEEISASEDSKIKFNSQHIENTIDKLSEIYLIKSLVSIFGLSVYEEYIIKKIIDNNFKEKK